MAKGSGIARIHTSFFEDEEILRITSSMVDGKKSLATTALTVLEA
jgi:hypothetical protein